jgi:mycothiol synthase
VKARPLTPGDAAAVTALVRADEEAIRGKPSHIEQDEVETWWSRSDLPNGSWLFEDDGAAAAVGWFAPSGEIGSFVGIVAQESKGRGLGGQLVERGETAVRAHGLSRAHTFVMPEDAAAAALLGSRGYREVRRFYEMALELTAEPAVPAVAPPLVLDVFHEDDAQGFHAAMIESFQDHWEWHGEPFDEWWAMRRGQDADANGPLWFLVRDGDEIAAVARNEAREGGGYVGLLGVRRAWRGRGLAKALLYRTFAEFWSRGLTRVSLGVDAESPTGATKLYESVGMHVETEMAVFEKSLA